MITSTKGREQNKMKDIIKAKKYAKEAGVKGFRKLKLKRPIHVIGKQCTYIPTDIAKRLIANLQSLGFDISQLDTTISLAEMGLLDTISIYG